MSPLRTDRAPVRVFAPAKLNLSLHVTGRREDGYHLLDSIVGFADVGDRLELTPGEALSLSVGGPFAAGVPTDARNLVWRAAEYAGWTGHIQLDKELPHGAGIGGGSSDAAALLRAVGAAGDGLALGADVPVCVQNRAARMTGIGEQVAPLDGFAPLPALLVNCGVPVETPRVFAALENTENAPQTDLPGPHASQADWLGWLAAQRNDLEQPAVALVPEISDVLAALQETKDAQLVRMSGSGATCLALYPTKKAAQFAAYELGTAFADWWIMATEIG